MPVNKDNVTYVNFGARKKVTTPAEVEIVSDTAASHFPVGSRILAAVSRQADSGRLKRGTDYARKGNVVGLDVRNGAVHGRVAGSQNEPFAVLIQLPYRSNDQLGEVAAIMARNPNSLKAAREGVVSEAVIDILLGDCENDLRYSCDCPDASYLCKHVIAVVNRLALKMDADPEVVFTLRGMTFAGLEQMMVSQALAAAKDSHLPGSGLTPKEHSELFWQGRGLPDLPEPKTAPALDDSDMDLLRKALRSVTHTNIELLRAVSDIEDLYDHLTR